MVKCAFCGVEGAEVECEGGCVAKYCNEAHALEHAQYGHQKSADGGQTPCEQIRRFTLMAYAAAGAGDEKGDLKRADELRIKAIKLGAIGSRGSREWLAQVCYKMSLCSKAHEGPPLLSWLVMPHPASTQLKAVLRDASAVAGTP